MRTVMRGIVSTLAVTILAIFGSISAAHAAGPSYVHIKNLYGLCLDAENDAANQPNNNGDKVQLWYCGPQDNQVWALVWIRNYRYVRTGATLGLYEIKNADDLNMCLDAENDRGGSPANPGDKVQLWRCSGATNQLWALDGINPVFSAWINNYWEDVLDAEIDGSYSPAFPGDRVQIWPPVFDGSLRPVFSANQEWMLY